VLGDSLRQNPDALFTSRKMGAELMDTGNYAYAAVCFIKMLSNFYKKKRLYLF